MIQPISPHLLNYRLLHFLIDAILQAQLDEVGTQILLVGMNPRQLLIGQELISRFHLPLMSIIVLRINVLQTVASPIE